MGPEDKVEASLDFGDGSAASTAADGGIPGLDFEIDDKNKTQSKKVSSFRRRTFFVNSAYLHCCDFFRCLILNLFRGTSKPNGMTPLDKAWMMVRSYAFI